MCKLYAGFASASIKRSLRVFTIALCLWRSDSEQVLQIAT